MSDDGQRLQHIFNEVRPVRGFEDIALQIQQAVLDGRLKAGDRLPNERYLGQMFGVSRPTLREAIRVLEAEGTVEVRRGTQGGTFISEPNPQQVSQALEALIRFRGATVNELAEFRTIFESETAYWAAKRATPEQTQRLQDLAHQFHLAAHIPTTPWSKLVDLDIAFHEEVAYASHNQIRVAIMLAVHGVLHKSSLIIGNVDDLAWREQQAADLIAIAQAISRTHARMAKRYMKEHVSRNVEVGVKEHQKLTSGPTGTAYLSDDASSESERRS